MHQPTFDADPASILFNLPGYRVISVRPAADDALRQVTAETIEAEGACPACGVLSARVQARPRQEVKDVTCGAERLDVIVRKRRYIRAESPCPTKTFTEQTDQPPARARVTTRLAQQVITACRLEPRAVSRVAHEAGLAWPTVMRLLTSTIDLTGAIDRRHVRHLGVDEHRFRRVRYVRDEHGATSRIEPCSIVFTDLDIGAILDVVDSRRGATVKAWLAARPRASSVYGRSAPRSSSDRRPCARMTRGPGAQPDPSACRAVDVAVALRRPGRRLIPARGSG